MLGLLVHRNGDEVTLHCRGKIVAGRAVNVLRLAAKMRRERSILLDLSQVPVLDAAGVGVLVELHHALAAAGKQLRFSRVSSRVRRTIKLVKLDGVLDLPNGHAMAA
jgi:anti-anti-sigma factor